MNYRIIISLTGSFFVLNPGLVTSNPIVNINNKYYTVSGVTVYDIRRSLNMRSPIMDRGQKYDARTAWYVKARWKYQKSRVNGLCTMTKVQTYLNVRYTMPKLTDIGIANRNAIYKWKYYISALFRHEQGHKEFGVRAAREIESRIMNLSGSNNCQVLSSNAKRVIRTVMQKYKYLEREYDRVTNHGMNNGARFP